MKKGCEEGSGSEGPVPLATVLGSVLEATLLLFPSWPRPLGVRTTHLSHARTAPSTSQDQVLLTLPTLDSGSGAGSYDGAKVAGVIGAVAPQLAL